MSATWPEKITGGQSRFFVSSSSFIASTAPMVAAPHGTNPSVTYWSVIRPGSNTGRGIVGRTPAAVQSTWTWSAPVGSSPSSKVIRSAPTWRTRPRRTTSSIERSASTSVMLTVAPRNAWGSTVGVDPEEHLVGLEPVGEVLGILGAAAAAQPTGPGAA